MSNPSLIKGLVAFQKECPKLDFDKSVRTKKYNFAYVSLANMIATTKPVLSKNSLAIIQYPVAAASEGSVGVETVLLHESGESISGTFEMKIPVARDRESGESLPVTPQDVGSAISYARRYAYAAMLGLIADEDNDGLPIDEIYQDTPENKVWIKMACERLGITNLETVKEIHAKMIAAKCTKDEQVIKRFID